MNHSVLSLGPLGLLAAVSLIAPSATQAPIVLRDAFAAPGGALFLAEVRGERDLAVRVLRDGSETVIHPDLSALPDGSRLVDLRIVPWLADASTDRSLLALVVEQGERHTYHFLHGGIDGNAQALSEPLFETAGAPFAIVDLRLLGRTADGLEITYRRGQFAWRGESDDVEQLVYMDNCSPIAKAVQGKSLLIDVRTGKRLPLAGRIR